MAIFSPTASGANDCYVLFWKLIFSFPVFLWIFLCLDKASTLHHLSLQKEEKNIEFQVIILRSESVVSEKSQYMGGKSQNSGREKSEFCGKIGQDSET